MSFISDFSFVGSIVDLIKTECTTYCKDTETLYQLLTIYQGVNIGGGESRVNYVVDHTMCYGLFSGLLELCARTYPHLRVGRP